MITNPRPLGKNVDRNVDPINSLAVLNREGMDGVPYSQMPCDDADSLSLAACHRDIVLCPIVVTRPEGLQR